MYIITGTQRSGTSFLAKFLSICEYDLGTDFWDDRVDGGLENPDICNFFRDILGTNRFPFRKYWNLIENKQFNSFYNLDLTVAKFSYLCMLPELITTWKNSRGIDDHFIIMNRDPVKSVKSKERLSEIFYKEDYKGLRQTPSELKANKESSMALMDQYGMNYTIIDFPFTSGNDVIKILTDIGFNLPINAIEIFNALYKPDEKVHIK